MGVMDKFLNYMKLNDEEDEGFYDDDYLDDEEEVEPVKKFGAAKNRQQAQDEETLDDKGKRTSQPKVTPIHRTVTKKMPGTGMEVCVIKPTSVGCKRNHGDIVKQPHSCFECGGIRCRDCAAYH